MMRRFLYICVMLLLFLGGHALAEVDSWGDYGSDPITILDKVRYEANNDGVGYEIQDTALDAVDAGPGKYRIHNTLDWIRKNISPYIQWMVYIGLSVAVILFIYNGLLLVTGGLHDSGKIETVKGNLLNVVIGVLILTGFYSLFKIIMAIINTMFGGGGDIGL